MKLLRIFLTSMAMLFAVVAATTLLPVPAADAIWPFGSVRAHVSRSTGLWMITNSTNSQVTVKYRARLRSTDVWLFHNATIPAKSDRLLGFDAKTYKLEVVSRIQ